MATATNYTPHSRSYKTPSFIQKEQLKVALKLSGLPFTLDQGCRFSTSCLNCHLPKCALDMTPSEAKRLRAGLAAKALVARAQVLLDRGVRKHAAVAMLAAQDGVLPRTIYRRLQNAPQDTVKRS